MKFTLTFSETTKNSNSKKRKKERMDGWMDGTPRMNVDITQNCCQTP
jgi:hypothetical protein